MNRKKHCERVKMQIVFRSGNTDSLLDSFGKAAIKQGRSKEEIESAEGSTTGVSKSIVISGTEHHEITKSPDLAKNISDSFTN